MLNISVKDYQLCPVQVQFSYQVTNQIDQFHIEATTPPTAACRLLTEKTKQAKINHEKKGEEGEKSRDKRRKNCESSWDKQRDKSRESGRRNWYEKTRDLAIADTEEQQKIKQWEAFRDKWSQETPRRQLMRQILRKIKKKRDGDADQINTMTWWWISGALMKLAHYCLIVFHNKINTPVYSHVKPLIINLLLISDTVHSTLSVESGSLCLLVDLDRTKHYNLTILLYVSSWLVMW